MRFEIIDGAIKDFQSERKYETFEDICKLLNEQEIDKMHYKRRLKTLKYKIQKILDVENV